MDTVRRNKAAPLLERRVGTAENLIILPHDACAVLRQRAPKNKHGRGRGRTYQVDSRTLEFDDKVDFAFGVSGTTGKSTCMVVKVHGVDIEVLVDYGAT